MGDLDRRGLKNTLQDKLLNALSVSTFIEASHIIPMVLLCHNVIDLEGRP